MKDAALRQYTRKSYTVGFYPEIGLLHFPAEAAAELHLHLPGVMMWLTGNSYDLTAPALALRKPGHLNYERLGPRRPHNVLLDEETAGFVARWAANAGLTENGRGVIWFEYCADSDVLRPLGNAPETHGGPSLFYSFVLPEPLSPEEFATSHDGYEVESEAIGAQIIIRKGGQEAFIPAAAVELLQLRANCFMSVCCFADDAPGHGAELAITYPDAPADLLTGDVTRPLEWKEYEGATLLNIFPELATGDMVVSLATHKVNHDLPLLFPAADGVGREINWRLRAVMSETAEGEPETGERVTNLEAVTA